MCVSVAQEHPLVRCCLEIQHSSETYKLHLTPRAPEFQQQGFTDQRLSPGHTPQKEALTPAGIQPKQDDIFILEAPIPSTPPPPPLPEPVEQHHLKPPHRHRLKHLLLPRRHHRHQRHPRGGGVGLRCGARPGLPLPVRPPCRVGRGAGGPGLPGLPAERRPPAGPAPLGAVHLPPPHQGQRPGRHAGRNDPLPDGHRRPLRPHLRLHRPPRAPDLPRAALPVRRAVRLGVRLPAGPRHGPAGLRGGPGLGGAGVGPGALHGAGGDRDGVAAGGPGQGRAALRVQPGGVCDAADLRAVSPGRGAAAVAPRRLPLVPLLRLHGRERPLARPERGGHAVPHRAALRRHLGGLDRHDDLGERPDRPAAAVGRPGAERGVGGQRLGVSDGPRADPGHPVLPGGGSGQGGSAELRGLDQPQRGDPGAEQREGRPGERQLRERRRHWEREETREGSREGTGEGADVEVPIRVRLLHVGNRSGERLHHPSTSDHQHQPATFNSNSQSGCFGGWGFIG